MRVRALPLLTSLLAALAVVMGARLPGAHIAFALSFAVALVWRVAFGLDGRGLVPRKVGGLLLGALLAMALPYLLSGAASADAPAFFQALIGVLTCFLSLLLLVPLSAFGAFWVLLLATTLVAVSCSLDAELVGALLVPVYVGLLALTLIALERVASSLGDPREATPARLVLHDAGSPPGRALRAGGLRLVVTGLSLGLVLWAVAPRPSQGGDDARERRGAGGTAGGDPFGRDPERGTERAVTGPDVSTHDALLGAVERIQQDKRVHWEVRLLEGAPDPPILLREAVRDLWIDLRDQPAPRWRSSQGERSRFVRPAGNGWATLDLPQAGRAERSLEAHARMGLGLLVLEPEPLAFRVERPIAEDLSGPRAALIDATELLGSGRLRRLVVPGDVILMRSQPQLRSGVQFQGRESSARVAPLSVYATMEAGQRERLLELTRDVPGVQGPDAWRRAQALEAWLRGPDFVYELMSPSLRPGRRVEDFLTRVKRGNCEWYATALTLVLRAHGMASRYVQGYWGGSHTRGSNLWTFYGAHYHAWTELYLDGVGWVPLNPTPPERLADGADPRTGEAGRGATDPESSSAPAPGVRLREAIGGLASATAGAIAWSFGPEAFYAGFVVLGLVAFFAWSRRQRAAHASVPTDRPAQRSAHGPYLEALRLLARHGKARRSGWTAREFLRRVRGDLEDDGAEALARLTQAHELERYAARPGPGREAHADLQRLGHSLKHPARGTTTRR